MQFASAPAPKHNQPWRWVALVIVVGVVGVLAYVAFGGSDDDDGGGGDSTPTAASDSRSGSDASSKTTGGPEDAFNRLVDSLKGGFDAAMYASAFAQAPQCTLQWPADVTMGDDFEPDSVRADKNGADQATVFVTHQGQESALPWPVVLRDGTWVIDANPCEVLVALVGAAGRASDSAAKSDLRNALVSAKVAYTDDESFAGLTPQLMAEIEPSVRYDWIENAGEGVVGIGALSDDRVLLVTKSSSGTYFCVAEDANIGTSFGQGDALEAVDTFAECNHPSWGGGD